MIKYKILFTVLFVLNGLFCLSQDLCYDNNKEFCPCKERDTLIEKQTLVKYILNRSERCISAVDSTGKLLWETNPWDQKAFAQYENEHAVFMRIYTKSNYIIMFGGFRNYENDDDTIIPIEFHHGEFGYIIKKNGYFQCIGND